jgi:hypothetical protein
MSKEEKEFSFYFRGELKGVTAESLKDAYDFMYSKYGCTADELDEAYERGIEVEDSFMGRETKLTELDLVKEDYSFGTWKEFCEEFGVSPEEHHITIYYDASLTEIRRV